MSSRIDHILETFGRDGLERRLSQHAVAAQCDAMALEAAKSHGLAMLRRRDEALLRTMGEEVAGLGVPEAALAHSERHLYRRVETNRTSHLGVDEPLGWPTANAQCLPSNT